MAGIATLPHTIPFPLSPGTSGDQGVGTVYSVALAGIPFLLDYEKERPYKWGYLPTRKEQQDTSSEPGEQSLSTGYWRRSRSSWHLGAGQEYLDTDDSVAQRFYTSKGVDPWTKNKLMLLGDTEEKRSSANTNLKVIKAGVYLYMVDGTSVVFTADPTPTSPTFTSVTGITGTPGDITSDGTRTYIASNGNIYRANIGTAAHTSWSTVTAVDQIGIANGYFLAGAANALYVLDASGTETAKTPTSQYADGAGLSWVAFASGPVGPLAAAKAGEKGLIFVGVVDDADGSLDYFALAAELPDGETVETIATYLGTTIIIGTSRGVRVGILDGATITYGPLISTGQPCQALEPEDSFVYFGWPAFDADSSGIGRLDLSEFTIAARPAYASDLMADVTGNVTGIATFGTKRYFVVSGEGLYGETTDKVESGYLRTGQVRWNTLELKHLKKVLVRCQPLDGTIEVQTSLDEGTFTSSGIFTTQDGTDHEYDVASNCFHFELKLILSRSSTDETLGPVVTGWIALGLPVVEQQRYFDFWVMCFDNETSLDNRQLGAPGSSLDRLLLLHALKDRQVPFDFQGIDFGVNVSGMPYAVTHTCTLEDIEYDQDTQGGIDSFGGRIHLVLFEVR